MHLKWAIFLIISIFSVVVVSISISSWSTNKPTSGPTPKTPIIQTPNGKYSGALKDFPDGSQLTKFMGIPFAQPPVGELRFKRPQPLQKGNFHTMINSGTSKQSCVTFTKRADDPRYGEDCLYLNVYVPGNRASCHSRGPFSVMVWLHPGGFVAGSTYPEPIQLVNRGNVIVVMVNYRMGVLGFLTTNDDALPGNNGLWDQYMAIKWVKENIRHFGGDDNSITLFGESAGSMSAHILSLSPVASNLFNKAIMQSGTASSLITRDYLYFATTFGQNVGCGQILSSHDQLADCLRNISVADIRNNDLPSSFNISSARRQIDFIWMPVIDGEMIVDNPVNLLKNQTFLKSVGAFNKDYMIGVLNNEGGLIIDNFIKPLPLSSLRNVTFYNDLIEYFSYVKYGIRPSQASPLIHAINRFYLGSESPAYPLEPQNVLDVVADAIFVSSAVETALATSACNSSLPPFCQDPTPSVTSSAPTSLTSASPDTPCSQTTAKVFFFLFDYCPSTNDPCRPRCMSHGTDFLYEFPRKSSTDQEFNQMSDMFIDVLTTFAKTSDPGTVLPSGWPRFEPYNQYYLRLSPKPNVRQNVYSYRTRLWLQTIPNIVQTILKP